jgi:hypothetical protein
VLTNNFRPKEVIPQMSVGLVESRSFVKEFQLNPSSEVE